MCYPDTCFKYSNLVDSGSASCKWGCPSYVDANCSKCNASSCYTDDCHLYDHPAVTSCKWGCKSTSSAICTSKCAECYPDNCRNRTDNKTEYGCAKYWDDCSSKCQTGQTCTKRDCAAEGYIQTACPANASCGEPCQPGCGDTTNYYKYGTCNINFIDLETYWCDAAVKCTWDGSFIPVEITSCSETNKYFNGTTCSSSPTGAIGCYNSATDSIVLSALDYAGGNYDNAKNDCINQGAQLATASDYNTLISCGVTPSNFSNYTFFARDVASTTCVYLTSSSSTSVSHGGCDYKTAQKYHLCSRSNI